MKTFMNILGLAIVSTALMFGIAFFAASMLRPYNREIVSCILLSIAGISMIVPIATMDSEKMWAIDLSIFCMSYFPIQIIMIAAFL